MECKPDEERRRKPLYKPKEGSRMKDTLDMAVLDNLVGEGKLCDALLYTAYCIDETASLGSVREAMHFLVGDADESGFAREHLSDEQKSSLSDIAGHAHQMMLDLENAASYFTVSRNQQKLDSLGKVASWYARSPMLVKRLVTDPEQYERFLLESALPHAPMYVDDEGFFIDELALKFILHEIKSVGVDPKQALEDAVRRMEAAGNRNAPKRLILADISGNEELALRADEVYDRTEKLRRHRIDSLVQQYCAVNDVKLVKTMQKGDRDNFFPTVANIYLVEKDDQRTVLKENIRLYTDFSRLGGYNVEREIYERLDHDGIIKYRGSFTLDGNEFLKFDLFDGKELSEFTAPGSLMSRPETVGVVKTLAELIDHMQGQGIMYMDVKSKNVLYDGTDVKLLDFGMAQISDSPVTGDTTARSLLSTPAYVPPEWGAQFTVYDTSEVFQLGVLFHELLTGGHPFAHYGFTEGDSHRESEIIRYSLSNMFNAYETPDELSDQPVLDSLLMRMLDKDPKKRPKARDVARVLENYTIESILDDNYQSAGGVRE